jgi:RNA polymerase sigma-70 factor (ECF subfamily)
MSDAGRRANPADVTALLRRLRQGDRTTLAPLMEVVYAELRTLARGLLREERPGHLLQPTALVNEAYIRLIAHEHHNWQNRAHFFGAAAQLMRRILIDHARASQAQKRGGDVTTVTIAGAQLVAKARPIELIALDTALTELEQIAPRQARIVELRYFGGLSATATAKALGINVRTVDRDWAAARVWLRRKLAS